ncbi:MAG TPA: alpha-ketoacid dehydrogenase subunit beta, partial [Luteimonas sp.]|nr:alpha-ketoacid dehydrogenase subunit beta [Luteimonas sp.]
MSALLENHGADVDATTTATTATADATKPMTMIQALRSALDVMMARDPDVIVFGQDVGYFGGVFRVTEGLQAKYGKTRCF